MLSPLNATPTTKSVIAAKGFQNAQNLKKDLSIGRSKQLLQNRLNEKNL